MTAPTSTNPPASEVETLPSGAGRAVLRAALRQLNSVFNSTRGDNLPLPRDSR